MHMLESTMAFAGVMIIFSTIVTDLVDDGDDAPPQAKKAAHDPVAAFRIASGDVTVRLASPPDPQKPADQVG